MNVNQLSLPRAVATSVFASLAALMFIGPYWIMPQFSETFSSFGTDLPTLTLWVINGRVFYLGLFVVSILLNLVWLVRTINPLFEAMAFRISIAAIITSTICLALTFYAIYLPIFQLPGSA